MSISTIFSDYVHIPATTFPSAWLMLVVNMTGALSSFGASAPNFLRLILPVIVKLYLRVLF